MVELAWQIAFEAAHLPVFEAHHHFAHRAARHFVVALPDFRFHVVRKQNHRARCFFRKRKCGRKEIAHDDVEMFLAQEFFELPPNGSNARLADRKRSCRKHHLQIFHVVSGAIFRRPGIFQRNQFRHVVGDTFLMCPHVRRGVGKQCYLVPFPKIFQNIPRTDSTARGEGHQWPCFYPEDFHRGR